MDYDQQIYINDDLSVLAQTLFKKARYLKSKNILDNAWTTNGKVFYKIKKEDEPKFCNNLEELEKIEDSYNSDTRKNQRPKRNK